MFTGIVQHIGKVVSRELCDHGAKLAIDACGWKHQPELGESIAVNGCCLTVAEIDDCLRFDVITQTLNTTSLGDLENGSSVNLEHAARVDSLISGHIVQGHIDGVGRVDQVARTKNEWRVTITPRQPLMHFIVDKGSIAVNGVSLTVASTTDSSFEVALIPTTIELTNLSELKSGSNVNLETDYLAKLVVNWMKRRGKQ